MISSFRREWLANVRADVLSGIVVALALIPEAIGFSVIAGVDPKVGLYASVVIACVIAFAGGRPAMISAATAATAVVMVNLVQDHGVQYLFAATILMGFLQIVAGFMKTTATYGLIALGLAIIYGLPRLTTLVPSPLVAIIIVSGLSFGLGLDVRTIAQLGALPSALPSFGLPDVPLTFETLRIIAPYSLTLAAVGLLELLLTAQIVDDMTDTPSDKIENALDKARQTLPRPFSAVWAAVR